MAAGGSCLHVFERDLGRGTAQAAAAVSTFNPEAGWAPVKP